jgi:hypothetical protein
LRELRLDERPHRRPHRPRHRRRRDRTAPHAVPLMQLSAWRSLGQTRAGVGGHHRQSLPSSPSLLSLDETDPRRSPSRLRAIPPHRAQEHQLAFVSATRCAAYRWMPKTRLSA